MNKWSREELDKLCAVWAETEMDDICIMFPAHQRRAIYSKASYMKLKKSPSFIKRTRAADATRFVSRTSRKFSALKRSVHRAKILLREGFVSQALGVLEEAEADILGM
jgi:hypothetical protein